MYKRVAGLVTVLLLIHHFCLCSLVVPKIWCRIKIQWSSKWTDNSAWSRLGLSCFSYRNERNCTMSTHLAWEKTAAKKKHKVFTFSITLNTFLTNDCHRERNKCKSFVAVQGLYGKWRKKSQFQRYSWKIPFQFVHHVFSLIHSNGDKQ